jgi:peroxiredoxin
MKTIPYSAATLLALALTASPFLHAQATEASVSKEIDKYNDTVRYQDSLNGPPPSPRGPMVIQIANDVATMKPSPAKVTLADSLVRLSTPANVGHDAEQAVATTLGKALAETPAKGDIPTTPYMDLAKLVKYEKCTTDLTDPLLAKATAALDSKDAEISGSNFTLKDLKGKNVSLSDLKGKIVIVNFSRFDRSCTACLSDMSALDLLGAHFAPQGFVVLHISANEENPLKINQFVAQINLKSTVLVDQTGKLAKQFHTDGIPRTFVFDRDGKLVAESMDGRTARGYIPMLTGLGLHN